jgi:catechol 2,3-dioxygenase-like lactoylglutathione lyase family enzyme
MSSLDHIGVSVSDFAAAKAFYSSALKPLGITPQMEVTKAETGGAYEGVGFSIAGKPFFWVGSGGGKAPHGVHVAFTAGSRAEVDAFYREAIAAGGKDNGPPGVRAHYHPSYYGAFVLDADGNNVEAVCHKPQ